jgi:hypothetical protein
MLNLVIAAQAIEGRIVSIKSPGPYPRAVQKAVAGAGKLAQFLPQIFKSE